MREESDQSVRRPTRRSPSKHKFLNKGSRICRVLWGELGDPRVRGLHIPIPSRGEQSVLLEAEKLPKLGGHRGDGGGMGSRRAEQVRLSEWHRAPES